VFIRTAGAPDIEAIRALLVETWHDTYDAIYGAERVQAITDDWHSIAALKELLDKPDSEFVVADDGQRIAGVAFAGTVDEGKTVMLHQLFVRPGQQGRGIGGLLLDEIEAAFPDADKVRLEVEEANASALAFYLAQGFSQVGRAPDRGGAQSGIPALVYERPIVWAD
jgi:ribosomal protein S18 acetylase RimI-like enzyme